MPYVKIDINDLEALLDSNDEWSGCMPLDVRDVHLAKYAHLRVKIKSAKKRAIITNCKHLEIPNYD